MRKSVLLAGLTAAAAALLRKRRAARAERDLWNEATTPPDLR